LDDVVHLISERFDFYHAGIFTTQEEGRGSGTGFAVLRAASSEGGRRMLVRGHRLRIGEEGIVGYVAGSGEPRIALDVGQDAVFFDNPDLPLTRSELSLPLKIGDQVIGILDVQSTKPSAFTDEDVTILQVLADQIAVAMENARLLTERLRAFQELEILYGERTRRAWGERLAEKPLAYTFDHTGVKAASSIENENQKADTTPGNTILVPIQLRGQKIGTLSLRRDTQDRPWAPEEKELINNAVDQIALAIENARLLEEIQSRAQQERVVADIAGQMRASLNVETVLRTAVEKIYTALNLENLVIQLTPDQFEDEQGKTTAVVEGQNPQEALEVMPEN
jgi:GAF domain-containing protein